MAVIAFLFGWLPSVCSDQTASVGAKGVVRVCRPVEASDPQAIGVVALILLLFAPDLAEMSFGGVTLKRVVEAESRALHGAISELQLQLQQVLNMNQASSIAIATGDAGEAAVGSLRAELRSLGIAVPSSGGIQSSSKTWAEFLLALGSAEGVLGQLRGLRETQRLLIEEAPDQASLERAASDLEDLHVNIAGIQMTASEALSRLPNISREAGRLERVIARSGTLRDRIGGEAQVDTIDAATVDVAASQLDDYVSAVRAALSD